MRTEQILIAPPVQNREELFAAFAKLLVSRNLVRTAEDVVRALSEREVILSTGIGGGVAAPHAQLEMEPDMIIAASTHPGGLDYPTLDGQPVRLAFCLLAAPGARAQHLAALARIARIARHREGVRLLAKAQNQEDFLTRLARFEGGV